MVVAPRSYLLILLAVLLLSPAPSPAAAASREVDEETQAYLTKGFELLAQNQLAAAQEQFALVIKRDFDNPFANNNLAVIMEKQGRWPDALAYLKVAEVQAGDYQQRIETLYLIGGVVAAVKPEKAPAPQNQLAAIIAENKAKLMERLGQSGAGQPKTPAP